MTESLDEVGALESNGEGDGHRNVTNPNQGTSVIHLYALFKKVRYINFNNFKNCRAQKQWY